jgi:hypothetical protein
MKDHKKNKYTKSIVLKGETKTKHPSSTSSSYYYFTSSFPFSSFGPISFTKNTKQKRKRHKIFGDGGQMW